MSDVVDLVLCLVPSQVGQELSSQVAAEAALDVPGCPMRVEIGLKLAQEIVLESHRDLFLHGYEFDQARFDRSESPVFVERFPAANEFLYYGG